MFLIALNIKLYKKIITIKLIAAYAEYSSCLNAFSVWFILQVPGAMEFGITSDDVFWLKESPKKTYVTVILRTRLGLSRFGDF